MSDAACYWLWATCLELQSDLQFADMPLLGLGVLRKDSAVHQCWLFPALCLEAGQQKSQGTLRFTSTSFCLLAA